MIYVVHDTNGNRFAAFHQYRDAFKAFKQATKAKWYDAALWHGSDYDGWTLVYSTPAYPVTYSKPWGDVWLVR